MAPYACNIQKNRTFCHNRLYQVRDLDMVIYTVERMRDAGISGRLFDQCRFFPESSIKFQTIMEIVSVCVISMYFGAVQLVMMVMVVLHPAYSSYSVGLNGKLPKVFLPLHFTFVDTCSCGFFSFHLILYVYTRYRYENLCLCFSTL